MEAPWVSSAETDESSAPFHHDEPCLIFVGAGSSTGTPRATCLMKVCFMAHFIRFTLR
jgi:hypothetical protein